MAAYLARPDAQEAFRTPLVEIAHLLQEKAKTSGKRDKDGPSKRPLVDRGISRAMAMSDLDLTDEHLKNLKTTAETSSESEFLFALKGTAI